VPPPMRSTTAFKRPSSRPHNRTEAPWFCTSRLASASPMPPEAPNMTYPARLRRQLHGCSDLMLLVCSPPATKAAASTADCSHDHPCTRTLWPRPAVLSRRTSYIKSIEWGRRSVLQALYL
jgi:hypothetical protein